LCSRQRVRRAARPHPHRPGPSCPRRRCW
jgi:hypothetical protein